MTVEKAQNSRLFLDKLNGKRIAVYGTGSNAENIINTLKNYNLIGFLDGKKTTGFFKKYPIFSLNNALDKGIDFILVAAELDVEKIIFERIRSFCLQNHILLYGIHAGNLFEAFKKNLMGYDDNVFFNLDDLKHQIDTHEIISFDIFDTLIMRQVLYPQDVFDIVDNRASAYGIHITDFKMYRIRAEMATANTRHTLSNIYNELQQVLNISDNVRTHLQNIELEVEQEVILPRDRMVECLHYAKQRGKRVYLISDMYLSKAELQRLLYSKGIVEYDDIFVSSEYGCSKMDGLLEFFCKQKKGDSYLHIGDNKSADGLRASMAGMDAFLIRSGLYMAKSSPCGEIIPYLDTINERSLMGMFIARSFNDPFISEKDSRVVVRSIADFSYLFVAPLITCFMIWLFKNLEKKYDAILFGARDGYLIQKLYEWTIKEKKHGNMPRSVYFYISRKAAIKAGVENREDLHALVEHYSSRILDEVFCSSANESVEISYGKILEKCKTEKENYKKYINSIKLKPNERYAFFDLISSGTSQYFLTKFYSENIYGYYLCYQYTDGYVIKQKKKIKVESMFCENKFTLPTISGIDSALVLESILSSCDPSVDGFDSDGGVVFDRLGKTNSKKNFIEAAQREIVSFYRFFLNFLYVEKYPINKAIVRKIWSFRKEEFSLNENKIFENVINYDSIVGKAHFPQNYV